MIRSARECLAGTDCAHDAGIHMPTLEAVIAPHRPALPVTGAPV
ncbi:hypothetical protein T261_8460 [Streptomyces lydicus]|nr:hypothetical protein T261_8460 [Streptomyces lydicus]